MDQVIVRVPRGDAAAIFAALRKDWEAALPEFPFDLRLLDERLQHRYLADRSFSRMVYLFTGLTLLIVALGLYGLVTILLAFRVREIGVLKVLSATTAGIAGLLSKGFFEFGGGSFLGSFAGGVFFYGKMACGLRLPH